MPVYKRNELGQYQPLGDEPHLATMTIRLSDDLKTKLMAIAPQKRNQRIREALAELAEILEFEEKTKTW